MGRHPRPPPSPYHEGHRADLGVPRPDAEALGFPTTMFIVLFAVARTVGWIAQWKEIIEDPHQKIGRPRPLFTGATER
ncbi:msl6268 [Mesorhizobium japonicum MAFF 303099]|uniref:Msl6268 protein n=1 Tax=Mesorhizobium japonicum (strain LMG 29417 / CECT 9101 / MAFF 303099) TaxID=266835 RepID=Q989V3_RHILO|nr:msl6268 [Mesorhizobium japonicum MAFF 303099]